MRRLCVQVSWMDRGSDPVFRSAGWTGEAALCSGQLDGQGKRPSAGNSDRMSLLSSRNPESLSLARRPTSCSCVCEEMSEELNRIKESASLSLLSMYVDASLSARAHVWCVLARCGEE